MKLSACSGVSLYRVVSVGMIYKSRNTGIRGYERDSRDKRISYSPNKTNITDCPYNRILAYSVFEGLKIPSNEFY